MSIETVAGLELDVHCKIAFTCTVDGHNKFWAGTQGVLVNKHHANNKPHIVVLRWGRIGTAGQGPDVKRFTSMSAATTYLKARIKDKVRKGYVQIKDTEAPAPTQPVKASTILEGEYAWDL
jgi:predicted DNA-binding WGR domain protein